MLRAEGMRLFYIGGTRRRRKNNDRNGPQALVHSYGHKHFPASHSEHVQIQEHIGQDVGWSEGTQMARSPSRRLA